MTAVMTSQESETRESADRARPHLCHVFPSFGTGGPEVRTALLINALGDAYRHSVIALDGTTTGRARIDRADAVQVVPGPPRRGRLRHPIELSRLLRGLAPDAVVTYGWGGTDGILAARLAGVRRVLHAEDGFLPEEVHGQKWSRLWARRGLLRLARCVVVPSQVLVRIAARDWRLPGERVRYLANGIDLARFTPPSADEVAAARERLQLPRDEVIVGTVGRLSAEKNQARLLRAFAAAGRPARLLLVGDGPTRGDLEQQARAAGIGERVRFTGNLGDPRDGYRAMDVFALSSDTEQMPLVVLEAMATGLPVVSTDVGDVRDMVPAGNTVVATSDETGFAAGLSRLLDSAADRQSLGAANRAECARRFDQAAMIEAYRMLYDEVLRI